MRVFVTGATGFIGSATVQEFIGAGHEVVGLVRSDSGAKALAAAGAKPHRGDLEDIDSLRRGAAESDGVVHTGFIHDFTKWAANCEVDRRAIDALASELVGSDRPLIVTSGVALLSPGRVATEDEKGPPVSAAMPRASEEAAAAAAGRGVKAMAVRLPPTVHGAGDHGFVPALIGIARAKGVAAYIGDGLNRWPAVHRLDAAHLFRLALEKGVAGARYHGIAEEGVPTREIAAVMGKRLNIPVVSKSREEASEHLGFLGHFFALDCPASSAQTQAQLGWLAKQPALLADLDQPYYFETH